MNRDMNVIEQIERELGVNCKQVDEQSIIRSEHQRVHPYDYYWYYSYTLDENQAITGLALNGKIVPDSILKAISGLRDLKKLSLISASLSSLDFLKELSQLSHLDISANEELSDVTILRELEELTMLDLRNVASASGWSFLSEMENLRWLALTSIGKDKVENWSFLRSLKKLSALTLAGHSRIVNWSFLRELKDLSYLDLETSESTANWSFLPELKSLTSLKLDSFKSANWRFLRELNKLRSLSLSDSRGMTDLSVLRELKNLRSLDLWNTGKNTDLTFLRELNNLDSLSLYSFMYVNIAIDWTFLSELNNLKSLTLALDEDRLGDWSFVSELRNLKSIQLYFMKPYRKSLTDWSFIRELMNVNMLTLQNVKTTKDWSFLCDLKSLHTLFLIRVREVSDWSFLAELKGLNTLTLFGNDIVQIPYLGDLKYLGELNLNRNSIAEVPSWIASLGNLHRLDLSGNKLQKLPSELRTLHLKFKWSEYKAGICLENNEFEDPPIEIVKAGDEAIRNYFRRMEKEERDYLYEIKLLLLGEERAGKSSIADALSNPEYRFHDKVTTHGIDVKQWLISKSAFHDSATLQGLENFRVNIWDFGGQEIYHATHQFFLTRHSLYLIVVQSRKDIRHDEFFYWLNLTKILGAESPALIVLNKRDLPHKQLPLDDYQQTFPNIQDYLEVSCKDDQKETIKLLEGAIKKIITNRELLPEIGAPLPKSWIDVRNDLEQLKQAGRKYITTNAYLKICKKYELDAADAKILSGYFHQIGTVLHFQDDLFLSDTVFLNHHWVTKAVYKVLDSPQVIENKGRFTDNDLERIWKGEGYKAKRKELLMLMKNNKFRICFEVEPGTYLAPQLLDERAVSHSELWSAEQDNLFFEFHYRFMPKGILAHFIVKENQYIVGEKYWRYGVLLQYQETRALVTEHYFDKKITVRLEGSHKSEFLTIIIKSLGEIHGQYRDLPVTQMLPCCCKACLQSQAPHFFSLDDLERREKKNVPEIECNLSYERVSIADIKRSVFNADNEGSPRSKKAAIKRNRVFVSYARADKKWLKRVQRHFAAMQQEGITIEVWDDKKINPGMNWFQEIETALAATKVAVLLVSADFLASQFIREKELPRLLKAAERDGAVIMPLIVEHCRFSRNKQISQFQAVNSPDKPLSDLKRSDQERILVKLTEAVEDHIG